MLVNNTDFFKGINIKKVVIDGETIELPIRYYQDRAFIVTFAAPANIIRNILPTPKMKSLQILPGFSLVSIGCLQHLDTSIGPFNEVDIGIPVILDSKFYPPLIPALFYNKLKNFGIYMYKIFVSSQKALTAGIKVWNYPKVVAEVIFKGTQKFHDVEIIKDNQLVLKVRAKKVKINKKKKFSTVFNIFSLKNNQILKSPVNWQGYRYSCKFSKSISFESGQHLWSSYVRELSLKNICVEANYYDDLQYILNPPTEYIPP